MTPMQSFTRYEDVEAAMLELVRLQFYDGAFLRTLRRGAYRPAQIRHFAIQYSYYSRHFPRVLGAAIAAMAPYAGWWVPLADNLWDEAGRGDPNKSHERLYRTFLLSVDPHINLDTNGLPPAPMSPAIEQAVSTFLHFFRTASPLQSMAAVGLGSELFAGDVMGAIGSGLRHAAYHARRPLNLLFWDVHADEHEPRHYRLCRDILVGHGESGQLSLMWETGRAIALSEARMYEDLHAEMAALSD